MSGIELLVTCFLATGQLYTIPRGWQAVEVHPGGYSTSLWLAPSVSCLSPDGLTTTCQPPTPKAHIKMRREISAGDVVSLPVGCEVEARGRE